LASRRPNVGDILNYRYLWASEAEDGVQEGQKPRPCLVAAILEKDNELSVFIAPITHSAPRSTSLGWLIPAEVAQTAGLDQEENYIIYSELNSFTWRGFDVERILFSDPPTDYFGRLPLAEINKIRSLIAGVKPIDRR
jgi:hypothetical protein